MSNLLTNPIEIDTTMSGTFQSLLPAVNQHPFLLIEKVYWKTPASQGDTVSIVDAQGNVLLPLACEVAGQSQIIDWSARPKIWRDFQVTTLSSGTLFIFLR